MPCKIRNIECQVRYEHLCQIECQTECDMECQIACHFGYQIRCQIEWSIDPQEKCQNICQLAVRSKLIKCQKYARYNERHNICQNTCCGGHLSNILYIWFDCVQLFMSRPWRQDPGAKTHGTKVWFLPSAVPKHSSH